MLAHLKKMKIVKCKTRQMSNQTSKDTNPMQCPDGLLKKIIFVEKPERFERMEMQCFSNIFRNNIILTWKNSRWTIKPFSFRNLTSQAIGRMVQVVLLKTLFLAFFVGLDYRNQCADWFVFRDWMLTHCFCKELNPSLMFNSWEGLNSREGFNTWEELNSWEGLNSSQ